MLRGDQHVQADQGRGRRVRVGPETLRNWLVKYRAANDDTEADLTVPERARLKELEREVQELRAETALLKKASTLFAREQL